MSSIHPTALAGWGGRGAEDYEAGRPGYPPQAARIIGEALGVGRAGPNAILDLAAGTGKLTRELTALGAEVIAVEPVAQMRAQLTAAVPGVRVLEGTAEAIPLPDGAVHAVTVAQAFHWFDVAPAAAEIARVLDPGGGLAIVVNRFADEDGWPGEMRRFISEHAPNAARAGRDWRAELDATGVFTPFSERSIDNPQRGDLTTLLRRIASMSAIAASSEQERERRLGEAERMLRAHGIAPGTEIAIPTRTVIHWATLAP